MLVNSRNAKKEEIGSNAPPQASRPRPTTSQGVLKAKAKEALMEMMGHVMEQWFERYVGVAPISSYRH
ncbi:hypothetical protein PVK06_017403 [Gossypium arboreum]|uniref:Uncharacterized protein n=1 Tax=Gossypium arboreum TaxID=29729 RepID=A0ABR0Q323_GOSAR|nr:hypothetical protein PVK06_017403 [Gossypium arboreum]